MVFDFLLLPSLRLGTAFNNVTIISFIFAYVSSIRYLFMWRLKNERVYYSPVFNYWEEGREVEERKKKKKKKRKQKWKANINYSKVTS